MSEILVLIADTLKQCAAIATPAQTDKIVALVNDLSAKWKTMLADGTVADLIEFCRRFADRRLILRLVSLFGEINNEEEFLMELDRAIVESVARIRRMKDPKKIAGPPPEWFDDNDLPFDVSASSDPPTSPAMPWWTAIVLPVLAAWEAVKSFFRWKK